MSSYDLLKEVAKRLDIEIKITLAPWKRVLRKIKTGACDGGFALFRNKDREKYGHFVGPLHYSSFVIFVKKGNEFPYNKVDDLFGKTLAKKAGFVISDGFDNAVEKKKISLDTFYTAESLFVNLMSNKVDGFIGNAIVNRFRLAHSKYRDQITYLPKNVVKKKPAYLVISKKSEIKNKNQLIKKIQNELQKIHSDGTYKKIIDKYLQ